jgi:hypothetical protein
LALDYIHTGQVHATVAFSNPQLVAALSADAAGMTDQAREHFEIALRQARDLPIRILQPTVLYFYGRSTSATTDVAARARGRAMIEGAITEFRTLEMVLHAGLAERFLCEGA